MIVEQRTYTLHVGRMAEFLKLYEAEGLEVQKRILGHLFGWFFTEIGPLNQIVHMWAYPDLNEREKRRAELFRDEQWLAYLAKARPMFAAQESKILKPAPFFKVGEPTP